MRRAALIIAILLVFAVLFSACQPTVKNSEKGYSATTIRLMENDAYSGMFFRLMESAGILKKHLPGDVSVEHKFMAQNVIAAEALATDNLDFGIVSMVVAIGSMENDMPILPLAGTSYTVSKIYSNHSDILSMDDIAPDDKISIVSLGSYFGMALMLYAQEQYGDYYRFINNLQIITNEDAFASLNTSDDLAALIFGFPHTIQADNNSGLTEIADLTPYMRKYDMSIALVTNEKFGNENPVLVEAICNATKETVAWVNENPDEAAVILSELMPEVSSEDFAALLKDAPLKYELSFSNV